LVQMSNISFRISVIRGCRSEELLPLSLSSMK
jgi:hypothetical protein